MRDFVKKKGKKKHQRSARKRPYRYWVLPAHEEKATATAARSKWIVNYYLTGNAGLGMNIYGAGGSPQFLNISPGAYTESLNLRWHRRGKHYEFMNFGSIIIIISRIRKRGGWHNSASETYSIKMFCFQSILVTIVYLYNFFLNKMDG